MLPADLLDRRKTHFTLWRPNGNTAVSRNLQKGGDLRRFQRTGLS